YSTMLDSVKKWPASVKAIKSFKDILPDSARLNVLERSVSQVNSIKPTLELNAAEYAQKRKELRLHLIEWHRKFTMSIACLVLFLIGAPLGSIIRKGGIGTPLIIAVVFFIIFFLLNNFGERFVKEDVLQPFGGMWLATAILVPIGGFLIYKAMRDSTLFNQESYFRNFRKIKAFITRKPTKDVNQ
ncbi:MAG: LptF/LptG family permease, partial [Gemmatimonadaceae bacterium]|nr:LptF/LptG family permease [Chitinophagaceae bacterium]